jgi:hypothetical protein
MNFRYQAPAGDEGSADSIDRGDAVVADQIVEPVAAPEVPPEVPPADDKPADETPRDENGKFTAKKGVIPVERHEQVLGKERLAREAAEQRAAELEKQIRKVDQTETAKVLDDKIEDLEDKLESARLDGNKEKALELAREIRKLEREASAAASADVGNQARDQAREEMRLDLTIEKLEVQYPVLQDGGESYDQDVVDLVLATQRDLIQRLRLVPSRALEEAVIKVMAKITPASNDKPAAGGLGAAKDNSDRKVAQVAKNLDAANKQPASMKDVGVDGDKLGQNKDEGDASQMSYEEFNALPAATKAKMRGDLV